MTATRPGTVLASGETRGWHESLSAGAAGIALAHIEYARSGTGSWRTAQRWATAMAREPITGLGATGHGPDAPDLADRLVHQIHAWGSDCTAHPHITAHPTSTPGPTVPAGLVITRRHTRLVVCI